MPVVVVSENIELWYKKPVLSKNITKYVAYSHYHNNMTPPPNFSYINIESNKTKDIEKIENQHKIL